MITQLIPIFYFPGLVYQKTAIPLGQFCLSNHLSVVCSTCLSGSCIQQCCPPGQVRGLDGEWRQPTVGQYRGSVGVFIDMLAGRVFGSFQKSILVPFNISSLPNASKYSASKFGYFVRAHSGPIQGFRGVFIDMIDGRVLGSFQKSILVPFNISGLPNASKYSATKFGYFVKAHSGPIQEFRRGVH